MSDKKLLAVRVRGTIGDKTHDVQTMKILKLMKTNMCALVPDTPDTRNMLKTVSHLVTWGEASDAEIMKAFTTLKKIKKTQGGVCYAALAPPKGGFERKGVKTPFSKGGAMGYRGEKISLLVKRMM